MLRQGLALLRPGQRVVVAVSGGVDSSALLCALVAVAARLELQLEVAHLDHGWRDPAAGAAEAGFVRALAERWQLPFHTRRIKSQGSGASGSREAEARRVRYAYLGEVAQRVGADAVALGHTRDDQVETILHRALRGTSVRGLGGMPARRRLARGSSCWIVRPLLDQSRVEGEAYLRTRGVAWREDPSNADPSLTRNRLRQRVLPLLRAEVNPLVDDALLRLGHQARRSGQAVASAARALRGPLGLSLTRLRGAELAVASEAIHALASESAPGRIEARHVRAAQRVVRLGRGSVNLPGGERLSVVDGHLALASPSPPALRATPAAPVALEIGGDALDSGAGLRFSARLIPPPAEVRTDPAERVLLDAARLPGPLSVRRRRPGDRFWPLGAPGSRSLKRFLIDQKIPREARDAIPVVTSNDRPVWIVGLRMDDHFKVTPQTAQVLELRASAAVVG